MKKRASKFKEYFGDFWCLLYHAFILDKHVYREPNGPQKCKKCGRIWDF